MEIKSILIVEDSEADQFINGCMIERFDSSIKIVKAYDGRQALDTLAELDEEPSVILLDINMPHMNGFEFLEKFQKTDYTSTIVMLSSSSQDSDREKALSFDAVKKYITKPLGIEDIQEISEL